jgi:hypothetical protein
MVLSRRDGDHKRPGSQDVMVQEKDSGSMNDFSRDAECRLSLPRSCQAGPKDLQMLNKRKVCGIPGDLLLSRPQIRIQRRLIAVKFDKRYWLFIAAAMFFASIASASTLYLASVQEHFMECNSVAAACFARIGMVPCMLLGILLLLPLMVAIPYLFGQNEKPGLLSVLVLGCIVAYTLSDAVNNVSAIMGYHTMYLVAHAVLDTTNNVTGNVVGTGDSLC